MSIRRVPVALALQLIAASVFAAEAGHHWSYKGEGGPSHWGKMEKEFATCGIGKTQSPIDIKTSQAKAADLPEIAFDYKPSALKIIDNGHTVQVNYAPGSSITEGGVRYELVQFHFHRPREETIDGKAFPMEVHLVHKRADGKLAVVGVLLGEGSANPVIQTLWAHLPAEKEKETTLGEVSVDASGLLPASHSYYTYMGSLTTPPCSEGVTWFVLAHHTAVSRDQIARFGKVYDHNARPVQALHGRAVKMSQ